MWQSYRPAGAERSQVQFLSPRYSRAGLGGGLSAKADHDAPKLVFVVSRLVPLELRDEVVHCLDALDAVRLVDLDSLTHHVEPPRLKLVERAPSPREVEARNPVGETSRVPVGAI